MFSYQNRTALVTGASTGIGKCFAYELASRGMNLILVARSEEKLKALAMELGREHGINVEVIATDLSQEGAATEIHQYTQQRNLSVDLLINNAGFSTYGNFETISPGREHEEIMVNVAALVALCHAFIPQMLDRGNGAVLNVASTVSFYPLPYQAVYGATKAFVLSFSEALWAEYRQRGIHVLALCPGPVKTEFFARMGTEISRAQASPRQVVKVGLRALEQKRLLVIPGFQNNFECRVLSRLFPRPFLAQFVAQVSEKVIRMKPA